MGRPFRILHVLGAFNRGGVETWLLHVLRGIDRERFRLDFLVHAKTPGVLDAEVRALGSTLLICPYPAPPWTYARRLRRLLQEQGPYDAVHSHVHHFSGFVLRLAHHVGVPMRIAHSHTTEVGPASRAGSKCRSARGTYQPRTGLLRRGYLALMKRWLSRHATNRLSASRPAHEALFGSLDGIRSQARLLYCGIDLTPFAEKVDSCAVRAEFSLPPDAFVLGHVGRFVACKNHSHLVTVAAALRRHLPNAWLLLVGDGELRPVIEAEAVQRGVRDRVIFAGERNDVARLLRAMDVFVFPSQVEGLGLAAVEAQAAGLPCILSENVPEEATLVAPLVRRVALSQSAEDWAEVILSIRAARSAIDPDAAWEMVAASPFNVRVGIEQLEQLYASARRGEEVFR